VAANDHHTTHGPARHSPATHQLSPNAHRQHAEPDAHVGHATHGGHGDHAAQFEMDRASTTRAGRSTGTATSTAAPEWARWPRLAGAPQPLLRSMLPRGYAGFTEATTPRHLVLPATTSVPLVVKLLDSAHRPPAFVMGAHGSSTVLEGDCAPSNLEVLLAPLGAYTLLGLPMDKLSGQTVDLVDVLGAAGRRLAEQLRETPTWRQRFALLDQFLLRRLDDGPQPAPEVACAWERLVATGGAVPIRRLANEVGWSHKHLIARFRQQVGLRPKTAARLVRFNAVWLRLEGKAPDWADLARDAGYADQAHLVRDFHKLTGMTPTGYLAQVKSVQAAAAAAS
jgi:AraC-like DNA-binding protein